MTASLIDDNDCKNIEESKSKIEKYLNENLKDKSSFSLFIYDLYQIESFLYKINTQYSKEINERDVYNNISILNDNMNINELMFKINENKGELVFLNFDYSNFDLINDLEKIVFDYKNLK